VIRLLTKQVHSVQALKKTQDRELDKLSLKTL
jgi:hypothetical protein